LGRRKEGKMRVFRRVYFIVLAVAVVIAVVAWYAYIRELSPKETTKAGSLEGTKEEEENQDEAKLEAIIVQEQMSSWEKRDKRESKELISVLRSEPNAVGRVRAALALGQIGGEAAVEALIEALQDRRAIVRVAAATALQELNDKRAIDPLRKLAKTDKSPGVRRAAVGALAEIEADDAVEVLIDALGDKDETVRKSALSRLSYDERYKGDKRVVGAFIKALQTDPSPWVRADAALGMLNDPRAVPALIEALNEENFSIRINAARALGGIGDRRAVEPLAKILSREVVREVSDISWQVTFLSAVAESLGQIGDSRAVKPLIQALYYNEEAVRTGVPTAPQPPYLPGGVRISAAEALLKLDVSGAVGELVQALQNVNEDVVPYVARMLVNARAQTAVEPLIRLLQTSKGETRKEVAAALGNMRDPKAVAPLIEVLNDPIPSVRKSSAVALGKIGDKSAIEPLKPLLNDSNEDVRLAAAVALNTLGDNSTKELLEKLLSEDYDNEACDLLVELRNYFVVPHLLTLIGGAKRDVALYYLREISGQDYQYDVNKWREWWEQHPNNPDKKK
jgi:HEAT repeat protein